MDGFDVGLGQVQVFLAHVEGGVAEQHLEGVDVAAVAQEGDREGVAEAVGVDALDAGAVCRSR